MKRRQKDDYIVFVKYCIDNIELRPHDFVKKAYSVDLIRNNFSKCIVYNYFLYLKRYMKDGYVCKGVPKILFDAINSVKNKENNNTRKQTIECVKPKILSYEEICKYLDNEYNNLQEKYKEQLEDITKNTAILEQKRND